MSDCLFCKIINGDIPSQKVFENDDVYAFKDLYPQAKEHLLFISKKHSENINELATRPDELNAIFLAIKEYTETQTSMAKEGFRIVTNHGKWGGQTVFHTHFHVLGGEQLGSFGT
jgi:histidine triad (HIT) family protein